MATIKQIKVGSTTYDIKNSPEFIVGTWTAASGTWTGVSSDIALYDGKEIVLYLPFAGSGNATLNLTLAGGGTTGAKNVYYQSTTRMTTHYGQYSQVHLIYHSALNINGTNYEGWWSLPGRDTNTNTLLRTYASATNIEVPLIGSSSANSTTAAWSTYTATYKDWYGAIPNDDTKRPKMNLSTGLLTVPGGITANLTGVASKATAANLTTTTNAITYYTNTTGTFGTKASANGALYATSANGALTFGTLPIAQGGTGQTTAPNAINYLLNNGCTEGASPAQLNDYLIAQYAGGGTTTTTYHRRKISNVMKAFMPGVITVGTAAPSGGSNGDIYIQY